MKKPCCIICGKPLNDGIIISGKGICRNCEEKLVNAIPETDFYEYYKFCIRKKITSNFLRRERKYCQSYRL